jgi:hypothetical protein
MLSLAAQHNVRLTMPRIGEPVRLGQYQPAKPWWRETTATFTAVVGSAESTNAADISSAKIRQFP